MHIITKIWIWKKLSKSDIVCNVKWLFSLLISFKSVPSGHKTIVVDFRSHICMRQKNLHLKWHLQWATCYQHVKVQRIFGRGKLYWFILRKSSFFCQRNRSRCYVRQFFLRQLFWFSSTIEEWVVFRPCFRTCHWSKLELIEVKQDNI